MRMVSGLLSSESARVEACEVSLAVRTVQDEGIIGSTTWRVSCAEAWKRAAERRSAEHRVRIVWLLLLKPRFLRGSV
jgi:hypothetical protein